MTILLNDFMSPPGPTGQLRMFEIGDNYTVTTDDTNKFLISLQSTESTWTLSRTADVGSFTGGVQKSSGQIHFVVESGAPEILNELSHTRTARSGSEFILKVIGNVDGNSAEWLLSGSTAP